MRGLALLLGALAAWGCAPMDEAPPEERPYDLPPTGVRHPGPSRPEALRVRIEAAVKNVRERSILRANAFWTVFHGILGLGPGAELTDSFTGKKVNALDYICDGGTLRGLVFEPTPHGVEVATLRDSQGQGHQDQFIAEMAQWGMPADRKMKVQGRDFTFLDFVRHSQMRASVTESQELSWTVLVVSQYQKELGSAAGWTNAKGERLTLEDLVRYEVRASVEKAACGGTHRLFGITWALHQHLARGGKLEGVWKEAAGHTDAYMNKARQMQGPDGCFSTRWFEGRELALNRELRLSTTGHIFEWLALAAPDRELRSEWMQAAASALSQVILDLQGAAMDSGAMYHAVHGLYIYHRRMFGGDFAPKELLVPLPPDWGAPAPAG
jgi:hypothetical protein